MAKLVRAISELGGVVISALDSTDIVARMEEIHKPSAVVSAALGRMLTASQLMGATLKSKQDSITIRIKADGPIGLITVACDGVGNCKGFAENNIVEIPLRCDGKLDVGGAVGKNGTLYIVKDMGMGEPYVGSIPLVTGEIAEDITAYYAYSEQIPTVCGLGVLVNPDLTIKRAGGYLLQLLPGATEEEITMLENNIQKVPSITKFFEDNKTVYDVIDTLMVGFNPNILDEDTVQYHCDCTKDRVEKALISIGVKDLTSLRDEEEQLEMGCQYCDAKYIFTRNDIDKLIKSAQNR
ncbi:MAG: Hsp33 family molecular chaperone HslO [Oscillospiraceae bacterium]